MFSIFKSKPQLKELIPNNYVDIHSHILPGIDDGAKNNEDSLFILTEMKRLGFKKAITTPHTIKNIWDNSKLDIENTYAKLKFDLPEETEDLKLRIASEYFMDENFLEQFKAESLLTLKENYVLVEMSYLNPPMQLFEILFELQLKGYQPVLAHPERYTFYHNNFAIYDQLKKAGCLFQMNLLSSVGYYGKEVTLAVDKLLSRGLIDFVGSDIHHENHIKSFENKIIIKNKDVFEKAISKNIFFE
ncbi:tyrosine-protein phosphatase [Flavobacterium sp.]|jgi:tyrosine-protein phosphatase YwqE|uniref:tyrosine-protein phosphatase n=1 Tax=Flavobacterium sp. TaxID=239 RepID=UPI002A7F8825|nr:CpsB/CapC family capsule biosynthesis tyrosine phosphatase [Flavobacterium sp.]